ncbi:hypothetical protein L484_009607 [Morus notabilis]|uniref:Squamosa promoter-binding-like protein n=1 Tax=Morus notabilis TaxID=981085 RepID=W9RTQ1_9ROSA|nr:squamosa promoter-binding protein 1 [Morus notabilis]EXC08464.1 hypothetical protein L484_009607 [Morus notabilis]
MEAKWVDRDIIDQDQLQAENSINADTEEEEGGVGESEKEKKKKKAVPPPLGRLPRGGSSGGAVSPLSCQAGRGGADPSDAKRSHRRHKVCEVHSKAPVVLVAGLRQRFCQQCSRFHEVSEFDEAKRSCRRRLAGHNERRRKSSVESCHGESSSTPKTSK